MRPSIFSMSRLIFASACKKPQGCFSNNSAISVLRFSKLQIKNIKLHIVTDIKVSFNSMFDFRISLFGWGAGIIYIPMKLWQLRSISICIIITKLIPRDQALPCFALLCLVCLFELDLRLRILGYEDIQGESLVTSFFISFFPKPTTPGVPRWSPIQVLSWPDDA